MSARDGRRGKRKKPTKPVPATPDRATPPAPPDQDLLAVMIGAARKPAASATPPAPTPPAAPPTPPPAPPTAAPPAPPLTAAPPAPPLTAAPPAPPRPTPATPPLPPETPAPPPAPPARATPLVAPPAPSPPPAVAGPEAPPERVAAPERMAAPPSKPAPPATPAPPAPRRPAPAAPPAPGAADATAAAVPPAPMAPAGTDAFAGVVPSGRPAEDDTTARVPAAESGDVVELTSGEVELTDDVPRGDDAIILEPLDAASSDSVATAATRPTPAARLAAARRPAPPAPPAAATPQPGVWPRGYADTLATELAAEIAASASPRAAALHQYELGRLHAERLNRPERALECWREALRLSPGFAPAQRALRAALAADPEQERRRLDADLSATSGRGARVALLLEAGRKAAAAGQLAVGLADLGRALESDPESPLTLAWAAELHRAGGDRGGERTAIERRATACRDPLLRASLLADLARLAPTGDGAAILEAAHALDPASPEVSAALVEVLARAERFADLAALYETRARSVDDPAERAAALRRAARIRRTRLRSRDHATADLELAVVSDPRDQRALTALIDIYEETGRHDLLCRTLEQLAAVVTDPAHQAALLARAGEVALDELRDDARALAALESAVALAPGHLPARRRLGALYQRTGRYRELCALLAAETERSADAETRAGSHLRIAELYEERLGDVDRAITHYREALRAHPGFRPALRALGRLCGKAGRWAELVGVYEHELHAATDRDDQAHLLRHIAALRDERLGDEDGAAAAYEQLRLLVPGSAEPLRALDRLYRRSGRWSELVPVLDALAALAPGPDRAAAALVEAARVLEHQVGRPDEALERCRRALAADPTYLPALAGAGRLCQRLGRWPELIEIHRAEIAAVADPERAAALHFQIAEILEVRLGLGDQAAAAYGEVLRLDPRHLVAREALGRLLEREGAHLALVELEERLPPLPDPAARLALHMRLAARLEHNLGQPEAAAEHYRRALALVPDEPTAVSALARLHEASGEAAGLISFLRVASAGGEHRTAIASDPAARAAVGAQLRLARYLTRAPGREDAAAEAWERLRGLIPESRLATRELDRLLLGLGRHEARAQVLERLARATTDPALAAALLSERAILEAHLGRPRVAAEVCDQVLALVPRHAQALDLLEQLHGDSPTARLRVLAELAAEAPDEEAAATLAEMARLHLQLDQRSLALERYREALARNPDCIPAILGAARLHAVRREHGAVADMLERQARAGRDPIEKARCLCAAARLHRDEHDDEAAIGLLREVLEFAPQHPLALRTLEEIFTAQESWSDLIDLLEHAAATLESATERRDLWLRVAALAEERLADPGRARRALQQACALDPEHRIALQGLAVSAREAGDHAILVEALEKLVGLADVDGEHRRALHLELALLFDDQLGDPTRAAAHYRKVLELDPYHRTALDRLAALLQRTGNHPEAGRLTQLLCDTEEDRGRRLGLLMRLADIRETGFGDLAGATEAARAAHALDPGHLAATERLADLLLRLGDTRGAAAHLEGTIALHRARVGESPLDADAYRALSRLFALRQEPDRARVCDDILAVLEPPEAAPPPEHEAGRHLLRGILGAEDVARQLLHPDERGALSVLLARLDPALAVVWPTDLASFGVTAADRITRKSNRWLFDLAGEIAAAYGVPNFELYGSEAQPEVLTTVPGSPPRLILGAAWLGGLEPAEQRFALGRLLGRVRVGHIAAASLSVEQLALAVSAVLALTLPPGSPAAAGVDTSSDVVKRLRKALGKAAQREVGLYALEVAGRNLDPGSYQRIVRLTDDRAGLVAADDVQAAIRALLRIHGAAPPLEEPLSARHLLKLAAARGVLANLLAFAVSDEHFLLRMRLGLG